LLRLFKEKTNPETHKVLKGPFWNPKHPYLGANPEEEWAAGINSPDEGVRYKDPVVFFDLDKLQNAKEKSVFLLLYADDSGDRSWRPFIGADSLGDHDDVVGLFEVSLSEINERGVLFLKQPRRIGKAAKPVDIVIKLEKFDSTRLDIMESVQFDSNKPNAHL
jgi:hypothetical protein